MLEKKHACMPLVLNNVLIRDTNLERKIIDSNDEGSIYAMAYDGVGYINYTDGSRYEGSVVNGFLDGPGVFTFADDTELKMHFKNNEFSGQGEILFPDGSRYEGQIKDGLRDGQGMFESREYQYKGTWKRGKKHGMGQLKTKEGQIYDGMFVNDLKEGQGTQTYENGNIYTGTFKANIKEGHGVMKWRQQEYEGDWHDGKPNGIGTLTWNDDKNDKKLQKNRYFGHWIDGQRDGLGIFYYANTSQYEGYWEKNLKHGNAVFQDEYGQTVHHLFQNDRQMKDNLTEHEKNEDGLPKMVHPGVFVSQEESLNKLNNMLLRNYQQIHALYKQYSFFESREDKHSNCFCLKMFQLQQMMIESKVLGPSLSLAQINRFFAFNKLQKFDVDHKLDFIQFKLDFLEKNKIQKFTHFQEEYLRISIQNSQREQAEFSNEEFQKYFWDDIHDRNTIILKRHFFVYLVTLFYILNSYSSQHIDSFGESILKNNFFPLLKQKKDDISQDTQKINPSPQMSRMTRVKHSHSSFSQEDSIHSHSHINKLKRSVASFMPQLRELFNKHQALGKHIMRRDGTIKLKDILLIFKQGQLIEKNAQFQSYIQLVQKMNEKQEKKPFAKRNSIVICIIQEKKKDQQQAQDNQMTEQTFLKWLSVELTFKEFYESVIIFLSKSQKPENSEQQLLNNIQRLCYNSKAYPIPDVAQNDRVYIETLKDKKKIELQLKLEKQRHEREQEEVRQRAVKQQQLLNQITRDLTADQRRL